MKFRVHYRLKGKALSAEISADNAGAAAVMFRHHHRDCVPGRIEALEAAPQPRPVVKALPKPEVPLYVLTEDDRAMTDADWQQGAKGLQALKEQLRATPAPVSRPGRVGPSIEQRHRIKR